MKIENTCDTHSISKFLEGQMSEAEGNAFESHLETCFSCREQLAASAAGEIWWSDTREYLSEETPLDIQETLSFLNPSDDPRMMGRFGGYEIAGLIGQGGMGIVLKGFDQSLNRYSAIKVLAPQLATRASARNRFAREAQAAAAVVHENVIAIHGVNQAAGLPYLVMPYVRGESLQKRLEVGAAMSPTEIVRIAHQIAAGLAAAHAQGLVHRDIKPANILMPEGVQRVLITDFGLARAVDDSNLTRTGAIAGTPQFMSPEQARGDNVDRRSDLFSLGTVMYEMCTGRNPFRAANPYGVLRRIIEDTPRGVRQLNPEIPVWLEAIVQRLHAKSPEERFQSAAELAELLEECVAHLQNPAVKLPIELQKTEKQNKSNAWPKRWSRISKSLGWLAIVCTVLICAGMGVWAASNQGWLGPKAEYATKGKIAPVHDVGPKVDVKTKEADSQEQHGDALLENQGEVAARELARDLTEASFDQADQIEDQSPDGFSPYDNREIAGPPHSPIEPATNQSDPVPWAPKKLKILDSKGNPTKAYVFSTTMLYSWLANVSQKYDSFQPHLLDDTLEPVLGKGISTSRNVTTTETSTDGIATIPLDKITAHLVVQPDKTPNEVAFVPRGFKGDVQLWPCGKLKLDTSKLDLKNDPCTVVITWANKLAGNYPMLDKTPGDSLPSGLDWRMADYFRVMTVVNLDADTDVSNFEIVLPPGEVSVGVITDSQLELLKTSYFSQLGKTHQLMSLPATSGIQLIKSSETSTIELRTGTSFRGQLVNEDDGRDAIPNWEGGGFKDGSININDDWGHSEITNLPGFDHTKGVDNYFDVLNTPAARSLRAKSLAGTFTTTNPNGTFVTMPLPIGSYQGSLGRPCQKVPATNFPGLIEQLGGEKTIDYVVDLRKVGAVENLAVLFDLHFKSALHKIWSGHPEAAEKQLALIKGQSDLSEADLREVKQVELFIAAHRKLVKMYESKSPQYNANAANFLLEIAAAMIKRNNHFHARGVIEHARRFAPIKKEADELLAKLEASKAAFHKAALNDNQPPKQYPTPFQVEEDSEAIVDLGKLTFTDTKESIEMMVGPRDQSFEPIQVLRNVRGPNPGSSSSSAGNMGTGLVASSRAQVQPPAKSEPVSPEGDTSLQERDKKVLQRMVTQISALNKEGSFIEAKFVEAEMLTLLKSRDADYQKIIKLRGEMIEHRLKGDHQKAEIAATKFKEIEKALDERYSEIERIADLERLGKKLITPLLNRAELLRLDEKHDEANKLDDEQEILENKLIAFYKTGLPLEQFQVQGKSKSKTDALMVSVNDELELKELEIEVLDAERDLEQSKISATHARKLFQKGYGTIQDLNAATPHVQKARLELRKAKYKLWSLEMKLIGRLSGDPEDVDRKAFLDLVKKDEDDSNIGKESPAEFRKSPANKPKSDSNSDQSESPNDSPNSK